MFLSIKTFIKSLSIIEDLNGKRTYGTNEDYEARSQFDPKWMYVIECIEKVGFSIVYSGGAKENNISFFWCFLTFEFCM